MAGAALAPAATTETALPRNDLRFMTPPFVVERRCNRSGERPGSSLIQGDDSGEGEGQGVRTQCSGLSEKRGPSRYAVWFGYSLSPPSLVLPIQPCLAPALYFILLVAFCSRIALRRRSRFFLFSAALAGVLRPNNPTLGTAFTGFASLISVLLEWIPTIQRREPLNRGKRKDKRGQ